jgi:flagellin-like protein
VKKNYWRSERLDCAETSPCKSLNGEIRLQVKSKSSELNIRPTQIPTKEKTYKRKRNKLFTNKRALSEIFSALILAAIVIIAGAFAYNYANTTTTVATNSYVSSAINAQNALSERVGFENVIYSQTSNDLTVSIINCGSVNLQVKYFFIKNAQNQLVISPMSLPPLTPLQGSQIGSDDNLNVGKEGSFIVILTPGLNTSSTYILTLITARGSSFDYIFAT